MHDPQSADGLEVDENGHTSIARVFTRAAAAAPDQSARQRWDELSEEELWRLFCDVAASVNFGENLECLEAWLALKHLQKIPPLAIIRASLLSKYVTSLVDAAKKVAADTNLQNFDYVTAVFEAIFGDTSEPLRQFFLQSIEKTSTQIYRNRWLNFGKSKDLSLPDLDTLTLRVAEQYSVLSSGKVRGDLGVAKRLADKFAEYEATLRDEIELNGGTLRSSVAAAGAEDDARSLFNELYSRKLKRTDMALRQRIINARDRRGELDPDKTDADCTETPA